MTNNIQGSCFAGKGWIGHNKCKQSCTKMVFASWLSLIQVSVLPQRLQPLPGWMFLSCWAPSSSPTPFAALSTDARVVHELTAMQDPKMSRRCQLPPPAHRGCASPAAAPQGSAVGWGPRIPPKLPGELEWAEAEQGTRVSTQIFLRRCKRSPQAVCSAPFTAVVLVLAPVWGCAELSLVFALRADSGQGGPRARHWRAPGISAEGSPPPAMVASLFRV